MRFERKENQSLLLHYFKLSTKKQLFLYIIDLMIHIE